MERGSEVRLLGPARPLFFGVERITPVRVSHTEPNKFGNAHDCVLKAVRWVQGPLSVLTTEDFRQPESYLRQSGLRHVRVVASILAGSIVDHWLTMNSASKA